MTGAEEPDMVWALLSERAAACWYHTYSCPRKLSVDRFRGQHVYVLRNFFLL